MGTRRTPRLALPILTGTAVVAAMLIVAPVSPAQATGRVTAQTAQAAVSGVAGRVNTNGMPLNARTGASTTKSRKSVLRHGTRVTIVCQRAGKKVRGKVRTTKLWDRLVDGTYVSDGYITRAKGAIQTCKRLDEHPVGQVMPPAVHPPVAVPVRAPAPKVSAKGWVNPIPGTVGSGYRTKDRPSHDGVDIGALKKTPIHATAAGYVITAECNASTNNCDVDGSPKVSGCGWYVEIQHVKRVVTRYCHMIKRPSVDVGDKVAVGTIIGYVGSSGNSSGPHLHFEVHTSAVPTLSSNAVEPIAFLKTKGITLANYRYPAPRK